MKRQRQSAPNPWLKRTAFVAGALVLVVAVLGVLEWRGVINLLKNQTTAATDEGTRLPINLNPPSEADKQQAEEHKSEIGQTPPPAIPPDQKKPVKPAITYASQYGDTLEVSAYISGIIEDGGTCTLTLTNGSAKVTKRQTGVSDAQTTNCPLFEVKTSELSPKGTWTALVTYDSTKASGSSDPKTVEVQ